MILYCCLLEQSVTNKDRADHRHGVYIPGVRLLEQLVSQAGVVACEVAESVEEWLLSDTMVVVAPVLVSEVLLVNVVSVAGPATAVMMPAVVAGSVEGWLPSDVTVVVAPVPTTVAVVPAIEVVVADSEVLVVVVVGGGVVATAIHVKDHSQSWH